jgi:pimeloyl-ACP methyl ester carboxylesterase
MPHRVRSHGVTTERGSFAVLEGQPGHGVCERSPALLLPGYTGSKEDFLPVLEPLAAVGRAVVAMDLRGQYQSPRAPGRPGYTPDELAADVLAAADVIGLGSAGVHLVGHSMGGLLARHAALARPARILSLTLIGSGPAAIGGTRAAALREVLAALDPGYTKGGAHQNGTGQTPDDRDKLAEIVARFWHDRQEPQARAEGLDERIITFLRERTLRACPIGLIMMARYLLECPDRTDELAALSRASGPDAAPAVPVLVLYGENDDAWPPAVQDRMARRLGAERSCIPAAAHSPSVEAPDTTARTLTTFWNAAERRRPTRRPA